MIFNFFELSFTMLRDFYTSRHTRCKTSNSIEKQPLANNISVETSSTLHREDLQKKLLHLIMEKNQKAFIEQLPKTDAQMCKFFFQVARTSAPKIAIAILTNTPHLFSAQEQGRSLVLACSAKVPNKDLIERLLHKDIEELHLKLAVCALIQNRSSTELIHLILPRLTKKDSLQAALKFAQAHNDFASVSSIFLSPLCDDSLKIEALTLSVENKNTVVFHKIFTLYPHLFTLNVLQNALHKATCKGAIEIVRTLLNHGVVQEPFQRGNLINSAINIACTKPDAQKASYLATVQALIENGPIYQSAYERAQSQTANWAELTTVLRGAWTLEDLPLDGPKGPTLKLSLQDVEANPSIYLDWVIQNGFPSHISLLTPEGSPSGVIDAGGVRKAFVTTLFKVLQSQLNIQPDKLPSLDTEMKDIKIKEKLYIKIGRFLSHLVLANKEAKDPFLIGAFFSPAFYQILQLAAQNCPLHKLKEITANIAIAAHPHFNVLNKLISNPDDPIASQNYLIHVLGRDKECWTQDLHINEILPAARNFYTHLINSYLIPVKYLLKGLSDDLKSKISTDSPQAISLLFQGAALTEANLVESLELSGPTTPLLALQLEWIKEKITTTDIEWSRKFLKWVTERECIPPGLKIQIHATHGELMSHTCGNLIDFPKALNNKKIFLAAFDAVLDAPLNRA